jgi:serine/threonine-protein kinase
VSTTKICAQCGAVYDVSQKFCPNDGSPLRMQSSDDPLVGQLVADRYHILALIGEGGMGRVYVAEHVRMGRKSAVKVIHPALASTADAIARFNREAANACQINHPNVAQVYDFGEMADGTLYLAMEFIEGETLDAVIAREGPLPVSRAAHITKQVADALFAAHHIGIVHRDLKPENVMLARHLDGSDWVKVVDFGIAKAVQRDGGGAQTVTTAGVSLGTPEYMSPEQLAGEKLDHRTDIYSLGLIFFTMLTGELPYPKVTSKETLVRRLTSKARTLAEIRPGVSWPAGLQEALDRALTPEVSDRYDSVADFGRDALKAALSEPGATVPITASVASLSQASEPTPITVPRTPAATGRHGTVPLPPPTRENPPERPLAHRRFLPWAITTVAVFVAIAALAMVQSRMGTGASSTITRRGDSAVPAPPTAAAPSAPRTPAPLADGSRQAPVLSRAPLDSQKLVLPEPRAVQSAKSQPKVAIVTFDSLSRLSENLAGQRALIDSIMASLGPTLSQLRRFGPDAGGAGDVPALGRHRWLRPNGDSGAPRTLPPSASASARVNAASGEVRGHLERLQEALTNGDPRRGREELNAAAGEIAIMRELAPDSPVPMQLERALRQALRDGMIGCYRRLADSSLATGARCNNLVQMQGTRVRGVRP